MALGDCLKWRYENLMLELLTAKIAEQEVPIHRWNMWCLRKENDLQMQTALAELDQEGLELLTAGKVWPEFVGSTSSVVAHFRGSRENLNSSQVKELSHQIFLKAVVSLVLANSLAFICCKSYIYVYIMYIYIYIYFIHHTATTTQQYNNWQLTTTILLVAFGWCLLLPDICCNLS